MKKLLLSTALFLSMGMGYAFAGGSDTHLTGYIDDSMCAGMGKPMHGSDRVSCAQKCMKMGAKAVFVSGGKVYKITNQAAATKFAGKNVEIDAVVSGDTINIDKITASKS